MHFFHLKKIDDRFCLWCVCGNGFGFNNNFFVFFRFNYNKNISVISNWMTTFSTSHSKYIELFRWNGKLCPRINMLHLFSLSSQIIWMNSIFRVFHVFVPQFRSVAISVSISNWQYQLHFDSQQCSLCKLTIQSNW